MLHQLHLFKLIKKYKAEKPQIIVTKKQIKKYFPGRKICCENFISDGCSGGLSYIWRKVFHACPPWEIDCIIHDLEYHVGGTKKDRRAADLNLKRAIYDCGFFLLSNFVFIILRLFGWKFWGKSKNCLKKFHEI